MRDSFSHVFALCFLGMATPALGCSHDASVCVTTETAIVQYNPDCLVVEMVDDGCGVDSYECCQYCGFDNYPSCSDHEFAIDIVQPDAVEGSPPSDECAPELNGLIGDWLVYHASNFFGEQQYIELEGTLELVVDESPVGSFVDLEGDEAATTTSDTNAPTAAPTIPSNNASAPTTNRVVVAEQDFDGNEKRLLSGYHDYDDRWNGGLSQYFGVGSLAVWPQSRGVPANIADGTVEDITTRGISPDDDCGIFGQNRDKQDKFFAVSDLRSNRETYWSFDVAGYTSLQLSIDMGGISNFGSDVNAGGFSSTDNIVFSVELDNGCNNQTAFELSAVEDSGYSTRPMDNGAASGGGRLLEVYGDETITKRMAEDDGVVANWYLDKTPADGPGAGELDTFSTPIVCNGGSVLTLRLLATLDREAMVFDNIKITGIPETEYWNSNRRRARQLLKKTKASSAISSSMPTTTANPEHDDPDDQDRNYQRSRELYYSYWYMRYSYYGRMMCSLCDFSNSDTDLGFSRRRRRGRGLLPLASIGHQHSIHADYEAYISFHLTAEVTGYLSENGITCLGPVGDLFVYFAQTT